MAPNDHIKAICQSFLDFPKSCFPTKFFSVSARSMKMDQKLLLIYLSQIAEAFGSFCMSMPNITTQNLQSNIFLLT